MTRGIPMLVRFFSKLVLDILPAALASVIGGFLFTHYDWGQVRAPAAVEQAAPASAEMMQLVRDEHAVVASYLKAQVAAERDRLAAQDAAAAEAAGNATVPALAASGSAAIAAIEAKPLPPVQEPSRSLAPAPHAPLVIAQAESSEAIEPPGYEPAPLLAATINIKDHVVSTTQHAVAVITGIPSWIATLGGRISGQGANAAPAGRLVGESG